MKIRINDTVKIITGKEKGKQGQVMEVLPKSNRVIVKGVNIVVKHKKNTGDKTKPAGRIEVEAPMNLSNVMLVDPKTNKTTRVGFEIDKATGKKYRISKVSKMRI